MLAVFIVPSQRSKTVKLEDVGVLVPALRLKIKYLKRLVALLELKSEKVKKDLEDKSGRMQVLANERQVALNSAAEYAVSTIMNAMLTAEELGARALAEIEKMKAAVCIVPVSCSIHRPHS